MIARGHLKLAVSFAKVEEGTCYEVGYAQKAGTETIQLPFYGRVAVSLFQKDKSG